MKSPLLVAALAAIATLGSLNAHAAVETAPVQTITQASVQADLYKAWLTDTTASDEKYSYPNAPTNHASITAQRCSEAIHHPGNATDRAIESQVCGG